MGSKKESKARDKGGQHGCPMDIRMLVRIVGNLLLALINIKY